MDDNNPGEWVQYQQLENGKSLLRDILDRVRDYERSIDWNAAEKMNDVELLRSLSALLRKEVGV